MELIIDFPGGQRVDAHVGAITIKTDQGSIDQPDAEPSPFLLFLASLGTCAGIYVLSFCQKRNLPTDDVRIVQHVQRNNDTHMVDRIDIEIEVPSDFPEKYYEALVRSASQCAVKKHIEDPPSINTYVQVNS